ncbi:MAG: type II toxin-antitoxin system HicB family antitoxin [Ahrensia sp.]|nr:type II toxin-antitoxin system HicB family antitoxin [Ahrensia sp.]
MTHYVAFIDGEEGAFGLSFPDLDGVVAMGETIQQVLLNGEEALRDAASAAIDGGKPLPQPSAPGAHMPPKGASSVLVPLIMLSGKSVRANMMLDEALLSFIDSQAAARSMTRTAYVEWMTRTVGTLSA